VRVGEVVVVWPPWLLGVAVRRVSLTPLASVDGGPLDDG